MDATDSTERKRPLSPGMFRPREAPSLAILEEVGRLARRLAEAQSGVLSAISSAPWRVAVDTIAEEQSCAADEPGLWARVESSAGSMTFHQGFDRPAISALCECAMGGTGTEAVFAFEERPLSAIEREIALAVSMKLSARIAAALSGYLDTPVSLFDGAIAADDGAAGRQMIVMRFIANVFGYSGEIRIAMPVAELKAQLAAAGAAVSDAPAAHEDKQALQRQIGQAEGRFMVSLAHELMRVEEIAALTPGSLVRLSATTASPVLVSSGGTPLYKASLARSGDHLAVRITAPVA